MEEDEATDGSSEVNDILIKLPNFDPNTPSFAFHELCKHKKLKGYMKQCDGNQMAEFGLINNVGSATSI